MRNHSRWLDVLRRPELLALGSLLCCSTGCTSALTTAYLKGLPWDAAEHAAEIGDGPTVEEDDTPGDEAATEPQGEPPAATNPSGAEQEEAAAAARRAAVEEAVARLAKLGMLDAETQASLVSTLQRTSPEDWPAVVEEFGAVLAESSAPVILGSETIAPLPPETATTTPSTVAVETTSATPSPPATPTSETSPEASPELSESPSLVIRNACFASRVTAWGILDRCTSADFRRGQELIVYFELENLTASETAAGHTTCIDTALDLVTADGRRLHTWHFEPLSETCPSRRRDYFARYVLRIPEDSDPGECRVEVAVTDTLADTTATASLPLAIIAE